MKTKRVEEKSMILLRRHSMSHKSLLPSLRLAAGGRMAAEHTSAIPAAAICRGVLALSTACAERIFGKSLCLILSAEHLSEFPCAKSVVMTA